MSSRIGVPSRSAPCARRPRPRVSRCRPGTGLLATTRRRFCGRSTPRVPLLLSQDHEEGDMSDLGTGVEKGDQWGELVSEIVVPAGHDRSTRRGRRAPTSASAESRSWSRSTCSPTRALCCHAEWAAVSGRPHHLPRTREDRMCGLGLPGALVSSSSSLKREPFLTRQPNGRRPGDQA